MENYSHQCGRISWAEEYSCLLTEIPKNLRSKMKKSVIITGPSVSGKTTLFRCLVAFFDLKPSPTHTTRNVRDGEIDGADNIFLSVEEFKDNFLKSCYIQNSMESSYFGGAYYGCPRSWISEIKKGDINCFVSPTVKIAKKLKEVLGDRIIWIHMTANKQIREERLSRRNPEMSKSELDLRIDKGGLPVDIDGHDLLIDSSYLSAKDIFLKAIDNF